MIKKTLTSLSLLMLSTATIFAQSVIPPGYVSIYSVASETALVPYTADAQGALKLLGPTANWNRAIYNFTRYQYIDVKIRFHKADTGKQVALRYFANETLHADLVDLPKGVDTTHIIRLPLADHIGKDDSVKFGGIWLYNGASHHSFEYTGETATEPTMVEYVALKKIPVQGLAVAAEDTSQAKNLLFERSARLKAVFNPINATNQSVIWSSANINMATVDEKGLVTAKKLPGDVEITAKSVEDTNLSASFKVTITGDTVGVTGVSLTADTINIKINFKGSVEYAVTPANANLKTVTWMSSDISTATVDQNGVITGIKEGKAKLIVTTDGGGHKDSCVINIVGYRDIPAGMVSLYTLEYNDMGVIHKLDSITTFPGADIPGTLISDKGSILGPEWNWDNPLRYCDLSGYSELVVAASFRKEDVGKDITFRYAFSSTTGSEITNRDVTIDKEDMLFVIDLENDASDFEGLKRLSAVKFRSRSEDLNFVVDYAAIKKGTLDAKNPFSLKNTPESKLMTIHPSIPNGSFIIKFANASGFLTIFDISGNVVMQKAVNNSFEEISLKQGLYFVRLESKGDFKLVKFVCP